MASMSVSGVVSGMDWESMIDEIITNAAKPAQVKVNKKTNLTNKKSLFEEMKVMMNTLQSSLSALKLPSTYKAKTIDIERLDKNTSYKGVLTATANADASVNVWEVKVNKLATAQINRSKQITDSTLTSTLSGVSGKTIYINSGGQKVGVEVKSTDTLESLKSRINTALTELDSPLYITASVIDSKLILKSDYTGKGTMTSKETVNYNYSTGINRLSNISIPSSAVDNVKITASGKSYVIHKDFEVANGNEIRWRQYDRGNEVALDDTVNVKYTMAAGDVYTSEGKVGGTEASISRFEMINNDGTLADRLKIVEKNDSSKTYKYGTDFTITDNKVVWLDAQDATTNEPSSYTVTYNKTTTETSSASETKSAVGPTSYIVSYSKKSPIASVTANNSGQKYVQNYSFDGTSTSSTFTDFIQGYADAERISTSELSTTSRGQISGVSYDYVTNMDNISIDGYEYGKDYVLRKGGGNNASQIVISWNDSRNIGSTFVNDYRANVLGYTSSVTGSYPSDGDVFTIDYTHTYEYKTDGSGDALSDVLATALSDSGSYSGLVVKDTSGNTYSYDNGDFSIIGGQIIWNLTSDDDIDISDIATKFNAVNGTDEIPRVTLTDRNGILRTYLDLAGDSNFTMTDEAGKTYEYGRDYVVRVNDDGDGYVVTWAIASDTNGDGKKDIKDADTVLTTYAQHKELSTYGMQAAPDTGKTFNLDFTGTTTTSESKEVSSSDTDKKNIATIFSDLSDLSIDSEDYSSAITITNGSTTYIDGFDYTIDSDGNIEWLEQTSATSPSHPDKDTSYTLIYTAADPFKATGTVSSGATQDADFTVAKGYGNISGNKLSYEQICKYANISSAGLEEQSKTDGSLSSFFTLTSGDTTYTYGTDYRIKKSDTKDSTSGEHIAIIEWIDSGAKPAESSDFTLTFTGGTGEVLTTNGVKRSASDTLSVDYADLDSGTVTITQGSKTYYEGVDFTLSSTGDDDSGSAVVNWIPDSEDGYEWYYPNPGSTYTINHTDDDGNTTTYPGYRTSLDTLDMKNTLGMSTANGSISVTYGDSDTGYQLDSDGDLGNGHDIIQSNYSIDVTKTTDTTTGETTFNFRWLTPTLTTHSNLPSMNEELTVEFGYDANTFDLSDDGDGDLLQALGFIDSSGDYIDYTAADDAELEIDGQTVTVDSNDIGADYENEVIKGVTLHLKGTGTVSLDISHDAEKAVESIQTFVDSYNDLMTWMNTRMTEKQVDEDTAATIDSDDFRMRWGLLHGNSLLRNTKSQMRSLTSKNFTFSFTERKSSSEVYGRMSYNGLKSSSTLRLRIGSKYVDVTIDPDDTLETIVAKINDDTKNGPMHNIYYDDDGNKLQTPLLKASVQNDKLVINSTSSDEITMSGSAAMNALKMNYTYKGLYQIGIESTSEDYGKSGELVFDTDEFMTALEDNPDEVQSLMLSFVNEFSTWTSSMLNSSSSGEVSGTLTREIENIQTQIDTINTYLENYQDRLDRMEENLRTRYGNTETQFSKLSQQANSIAAILNQLNGNASGGGYGQTSS